jgi:hypothetical protein
MNKVFHPRAHRRRIRASESATAVPYLAGHGLRSGAVLPVDYHWTQSGRGVIAGKGNYQYSVMYHHWTQLGRGVIAGIKGNNLSIKYYHHRPQSGRCVSAVEGKKY